MNDLAAVSTALENGDRAGALARLLDLWRATRAPELAGIIDRLSREIDRALPPVAGRTRKALHEQWLEIERAGRDVDLGRLLAVLTHPPAALVGERILRLEMRPPDPRVAAALTQMATECPYTTANPSMWTRIFVLLHAIGDPRGIEPLRRFLERRHDRTEFFKRHIPRVKKLVQALGEVAVEEQPLALDELERRIDELAAGEPADPAELLVARDAPDEATSEAALLEQISAAPGDDGPRLVYADWLLERGDPRGELITLQFKRLRQTLTSKEIRRERALLREHARRWLGPIEPVVDPTSIRFERGFLAGCRTLFRTAGQRRELVGDPAWATVEQIETDEVGLLTHPVMRALRRVDGLTLASLAALGAHGQPLPVEQLELVVDAPLGPPHVRALNSDALRRLRRLRLSCSPAVDSRPAALGWLARGALLERVQTLELNNGIPGIGLSPPATIADWLRALDQTPLRGFILEGQRPWTYRLERELGAPWRLELSGEAGDWIRHRFQIDWIVEALRLMLSGLAPGQLSPITVDTGSESTPRTEQIRSRLRELLEPLAEVRMR